MMSVTFKPYGFPIWVKYKNNKSTEANSYRNQLSSKNADKIH